MGNGHAHWLTFHPTLKPQSGDGDTADFAGPYPVDGRRATMRFVKFTDAFGPALPEPVETLCRVEARLDGSSDWTTVGSLTLYFAHMAHPERYITYRNSVIACEGEPESTYSTWRALAATRGLGTPWVNGTGSWELAASQLPETDAPHHSA